MQQALTALVVVLIANLPGLSRAGEPGASFFEDFDVLNHGRWYISNGWSNGEWMNCTWSRGALAVENGRLLLSFLKSPGRDTAYICGEIQSRESYGHGTYEVRMKTGAGSGLNAAFFTYAGPSQKKAHHEIDVELLLRDLMEVSFNTYVDGKAGGGATVPMDRASDEVFIHYAFTWTRNEIVWFVDGRRVHQTMPGDAIPFETQKIFASLWGSDTLTDWMGYFDPAAVPQVLEIDWIAYTRLGEACRFPASILCDGET